MLNYLIAIVAIFCLLAGWLVVQAICRHFSQRHPEFGPHREEGKGCGSSCSCSGGECKTRHSQTTTGQRIF